MSLPAVSKHLKVLEIAGLVNREIYGRVHTFSLVAAPMKNAIDWLNATFTPTVGRNAWIGLKIYFNQF